VRLCVIPARGGSKRIPRKNIKQFHGKPIIAYSIEAAIDSECFDKIIVSTDDQEIASIARDYGAETPFIRPGVLADDHTGSDDVIRHAIRWYQNLSQEVEYACCIYATAPFVSYVDIQRGLELLIETNKDFAYSVAEFSFPIQRAVRIKPDENGVEPFNSKNMGVRSQDLETAYHDAGQFYWGKACAYIEDRSFYSSQTIPIVLPSYRVQDIDTIDDWRRAELMYQTYLEKGQSND